MSQQVGEATITSLAINVAVTRVVTPVKNEFATDAQMCLHSTEFCPTESCFTLPYYEWMVSAKVSRTNSTSNSTHSISHEHLHLE